MATAQTMLGGLLPKNIGSEEFIAVAAAGLAFIAVISVGRLLMPKRAQAGKVKSILERREVLKAEHAGPKRRKKPEGAVQHIRSFVTRFDLLKRQQVSLMQDMLTQSGWRSKDAMYIFAFFNLLCPLIGVALGIFGYTLGKGSTGKFLSIAAYMWPILGMYIGLKLPGIIVKKKTKKRYLAMQRSLADTLDLMTICAEAGLSLAQALDRVSRELGMTYPEMAQELQLTALELGFLPERNKALTNLAERVKIEEIRGIASVLIQTEKYGTPIAQALRVLSTEFRHQRMLRAEQKAARLPAIMTVPMMVFIFPTLFIVILAPAIIKIMIIMSK